MKNIITLCFALASVLAHAQTAPNTPKAEELLLPAFAKATTAKKKVLVIFSASWCGWCRKMEASLQDPVVKPLIDKNFEVVHLAVYESVGKKHLENEGALAFLIKHGGADKGLPYWYIMEGEESVVAESQYAPGQNTGCPASKEEVAYFINVLKKTTALNADELKKIEKRFRQNEN